MASHLNPLDHTTGRHYHFYLSIFLLSNKKALIEFKMDNQGQHKDGDKEVGQLSLVVEHSTDRHYRCHIAQWRKPLTNLNLRILPK